MRVMRVMRVIEQGSPGFGKVGGRLIPRLSSKQSACRSSLMQGCAGCCEAGRKRAHAPAFHAYPRVGFDYTVGGPAPLRASVESVESAESARDPPAEATGAVRPGGSDPPA
jgi:hypothetical protein